MQAWRKLRRQHDYSVHLTSDEAAAVLNEAADALNTATELGIEHRFAALNKLHDKLNAVYGSKETKRA